MGTCSVSVTNGDFLLHINSVTIEPTEKNIPDSIRHKIIRADS